ncbi:MAG TPA: hypothetical protein VF188_05225 [Longimicrobiales bacterium]
MRTCGWKQAGLMLVGLLAAPAVALGQACIGLPAGANQFAASADIAFPEGAKTYGIGVGANLIGPFTVEASYTLTKPDGGNQNLNTFGADVAFELPLPGFSACPVVGLSYSSYDETVPLQGGGSASGSISVATIPIGFGVGASLPLATTGASLMPYAVPQLLYARTKVSFSTGGLSGSGTDSSTEFGAIIGARLAWNRIFLGGDVNVTTVENSDPVFSVGAGLIFP